MSSTNQLPCSGLVTTAEPIDSLLSRGLQVGGVLRNFHDRGDASRGDQAQRFVDAVASARSRGAEVLVVSHALGEDWMWRASSGA